MENITGGTAIRATGELVLPPSQVEQLFSNFIAQDMARSAQTSRRREGSQVTFRDALMFWWIARCSGVVTIDSLDKLLRDCLEPFKGDQKLRPFPTPLKLKDRLAQLSKGGWLSCSPIRFPVEDESRGGRRTFAAYSLSSGGRAWLKLCFRDNPGLVHPLSRLDRPMGFGALSACQYTRFLLDCSKKGWANLSTEVDEGGPELSYISLLAVKKDNERQVNVYLPGWHQLYRGRSIFEQLQRLRGPTLLLFNSRPLQTLFDYHYGQTLKKNTVNVRLASLEISSCWLSEQNLLP